MHVQSPVAPDKHSRLSYHTNS